MFQFKWKILCQWKMTRSPSQAHCRQDPFHWLGCPVDWPCAAGTHMPASCSEGTCCMGSHVRSEPSVVSSPPRPLEMLAPAGQHTPAKNMGTTWPKPNEWEPEVGGPESVSRGWLKNKWKNRGKNSSNYCELLKTQNNKLLFQSSLCSM